jgi:GntR family transcriptional regulator
MTIQIDQRGKLPPYRQLAQILRDAIAAGDYDPGTALPSQRDLHRQFGISLDTIQRAVRVLVDEGLVEQVPARGAFVLPGAQAKARAS